MQEPRIKSTGKRMAAAEALLPPEPVTSGMMFDTDAELPEEEVEAIPAEVTEPFEMPSVSPIDPRAWRLMDEAPADGTLVECKPGAESPDAEAVPAVYRRTRMRDAARRQWVPRCFWANALTREELPFEPFCWRLPHGFLLPGMVV